MKGVMGSFSGATSRCIAAERIMKLVAAVSSSMSRTRAPISSASMMFAAWDVEPDASVVEKSVVDLPYLSRPHTIMINSLWTQRHGGRE